MSRSVLVTGGAGFIGSALAARLLAAGFTVTLYDSFSAQVHGASSAATHALRNTARIVVGDVCDKALFHDALVGQDIVVHLAAETGTGQSMYEVLRYDRVNNHGTAVLLDFVVNDRRSRVAKVIVASSRAIYGEGKYRCADHGAVYPSAREDGDLRRGFFEPRCPVCRGACVSVPTDEPSQPDPNSFYGLTKLNQELGVLMLARHLGLPAYAMRFQNVYGPGQSLTNPYTGILAIFSGLARSGKDINLFEDGAGSRDFVFIDDAVEATMAAIAADRLDHCAINVGSGVATAIAEVAEAVCRHFDGDSTIVVSGDYRKGDIRHNTADLTRAKRLLGYAPRTSFDAGVAAFLRWTSGEAAGDADPGRSFSEMSSRGLLVRRP